MVSIPKKPPLNLSFIGYSSITREESKRIVKKYFDKYSKKYDVVRIVTIKDDPLGLMARKLARFLEIERVTLDRTTNEHNFLPMELTVATAMWAADRFVLAGVGGKRQYGTMGEEMCLRMSRKYVVAK